MGEMTWLAMIHPRNLTRGADSLIPEMQDEMQHILSAELPQGQSTIMTSNRSAPLVADLYARLGGTANSAIHDASHRSHLWPHLCWTEPKP